MVRGCRVKTKRPLSRQAEEGAVAKKKRDSDSGDKAQRRIQKAQQRLDQAREMYAEAEARGRRAMERAQAKAEAWRKEASELVQRRTEALERALSRSGDGSRPADGGESLVVETVKAPAVDTSAEIILAGREALALQALRGLPQQDGVTAQEWRAAAGMSGTTFARSRAALVRYGLVNPDGEPSRTTRYTISEAGSQFDLDTAQNS
jgi:hypothetical protein